jgi:hypothetical protein
MVFLILKLSLHLKVCCYVCMLLLVIFNDCVPFFWAFGSALDQNRLILHFCHPVVDDCHCCCFNLVCVILMPFLPFTVSFFLLALVLDCSY